MNRTVNEILTSFANSLTDLIRIGAITTEHLETTNRNQLHETHSLIVSVLHRSVCQVVKKECVVTLGHGLREGKGMKLFKPDITVWKIEAIKRLLGVIDYESTNSSDDRVIDSFVNYQNYIDKPSLFRIPEFWAIITTLPSREVKKSDWDSRYLSKKDDKYKKMIKNPFQYYFPEYTEEFNKRQEQREKCPLYVANLDAKELRLCLPEDETFKKEFG